MVRIDSSETSDPVDPLVDCSSFSLFPVSFNRPAASSTVDDPNPNFDLHSHLKALVLRSPDKLLKQAKSIIDESMKLNNPPAMASDDKAEKVSSMNDKNHQEKRPALGLKKAKFSAKPMSSQPDVVPEPSIDIGKLNDPVEFFAAYERMENAKKELQRLRGAPLSNLDQNLPSMSPRRRRPSLYGKSATYKHHSYSSTMMSDIGETFLSSQETSQKHTASPARQDVVQETEVVNNSQHVRVPDMTPAMETNEVNELDELLSCDYGRLDETGVLDLLQNKLQIKLRDIGKPTLPDFHHVQRQVSETSGDTLPQMTDAITRLNGIRKAVGSTRLSLSSQLRESSGHIQAVPAQPKSPLASISLLNRHISKRSPSKDPFSTLDNDLSPVRIHSPEMVRRKLSDRMDTRKHLSESQTSLVRVEQIPAAVNPLPCSEENTTAQGIEPNNQLDGVGQSDPNGVRKDLLEHGGSTANGEEANAVSSVVSSSLAEKDMSSGSEPTEQIDGAAQADTMTNFCDFRRSLLHRDQSVADFGKEPVASVAKGIKDVSEDKNQEDEVDARRDSVQQELNIGGSVTDKSTDNQAEECTTGNASNSRDVEIEEPAEEAAEPSNRKMKGRKQSKAASKRNASKEAAKRGGIENPESDIPVSERPENKKRKAEGAPQSNKQKHINRRNSLYAAGTKWEAGIRRSTRIRMRPLEYWKGERFLYGRVHASLVTVIGVKYASPTKEAEQPPVKVKSFVSDEYKELVDLAALH